MDLNILDLIDEGKCYDYLRYRRWAGVVKCVRCQSEEVNKNGKSTHSEHCQQYKCKTCGKCFDDRTGTLFSGNHQMLKVWVLVMYFMGLNLSTRQIASVPIAIGIELDDKTCRSMAEQIRTSITCNQQEPVLSGKVEVDEVYIVAGHKGQAQKVEDADREGRSRRLKGARGRGTLAKEKPPILGFIQRTGELIMRVLPNVQQKTIAPIFEASVAKGTIVYTDEYNIYSKLSNWGYIHLTVCHSIGEYARDEDGDGFCEVHVNTQEGIWSLLRSWLRPHRGISQDKLPKYIGLFQFVHNIRKRGKALIKAIFDTVLMDKKREIEDICPSV